MAFPPPSGVWPAAGSPPALNRWTVWLRMPAGWRAQGPGLSAQPGCWGPRPGSGPQGAAGDGGWACGRKGAWEWTAGFRGSWVACKPSPHVCSLTKSTAACRSPVWLFPVRLGSPPAAHCRAQRTVVCAWDRGTATRGRCGGSDDTHRTGRASVSLRRTCGCHVEGRLLCRGARAVGVPKLHTGLSAESIVEV